ncbi:ASTRA-associated protein 1 [Tetrabaena socialis]|uniref:ASTRA-associated protein 1 n=1 Tax=Tetrabaena socialis TaxID=47790 RepID=A0A2J8A677_9CHLO|nr:ASTRA-associated protein 1 [Tetrabaena socialis]|eukprot:PNH08003.1 ASTRA-associated protein 1 [Tetrabaena socialis]
MYFRLSLCLLDPPLLTGSQLSYHLVSGSADDVVGCCLVRPGAAQPLRPLGAGPGTGAGRPPLRLREAGTADVRIRPDGKLFACGCWDGRVRLYSLRKRQPLAVLQYHRGQVTALAFSPTRLLLASASRDTTVALWSVYPPPPAGDGAGAAGGGQP